MNTHFPWGAHVRAFWGAWKAHPRLAWGPVVVLGVLGGLYVAATPPKWRASQAFLVREEAATGTRPGRFDSGDALKTAQETLLELARNSSVLADALRQAGPPDDSSADGDWPTEKDIRSLQEVVTVAAPKGAEFGKTEVIYLSLTAPSRERALRLTAALSTALQRCSQQVRDRKAQSIIAELEEQVRLAQSALNEATDRLQQMERQVGGDLGELRNLNDSGRGDSNLRTLTTQIKEDLRKVQGGLAAKTELLQLLQSAQKDPQSLAAAPNEMLDALPTLRRLKEGLVEAQLRSAQALGKMSPEHPLAQAALAAEQEVRDRLRRELAVAAEGLQSDLRIEQARAENLQQQLAEVQQRLDRLAGLRAEYSNLVNEVRQRSEILDRSTKALAEAKAAQAAAKSTSLLTPLEGPEADSDPLGPGPVVILLSALAGGLLIGAGLVFLIYPPPDAQGRRWTDRLRFGRRATDPPIGRRATDFLPTGLPAVSTAGSSAGLPSGTPTGLPSGSPTGLPSGALPGQSTSVCPGLPYGRRATDPQPPAEWIGPGPGTDAILAPPSCPPSPTSPTTGTAAPGPATPYPASSPESPPDPLQPCRTPADLPVPLVERRSGKDRRRSG